MSLTSPSLVAIFIYLLTLVLIGWLAKRSNQEQSLKNYYLAGSGLGSVSVFFTLYATQYSGNTLFAVPGKAYSQGLIGLSVVIAVTAIVLVYFTFAPALNRLAKYHNFISIGDFIKWRYQHPGLLVAVNLIAIITLISYALGNFKAAGLLLESVSGGSISFAWGIIILAIFMAAYETLGGMKAVIWTDILQGTLLMIGCLIIFVLVVKINGDHNITAPSVFIAQSKAYFTEQINIAGFISTCVLIAIGAAVYPQAIQRMYIAKSPRVLKKSYILLLLMPFLTTLPMILVGISVAEWVPDLDAHQSEAVILYAIERIQTVYPFFNWVMILFLGAAIAAIMSTIDSALLSLGSTVTKDVIYKAVPTLTEANLFKISKQVSWGLMLLIAILAIVLPQTIWALMIFKFELLIQMAPAFILGSRNKSLTGKTIFYGLILGVFSAVAMKLIIGKSFMDIHAGVWGLVINLTVILVGYSLTRRTLTKQTHN